MPIETEDLGKVQKKSSLVPGDRGMIFENVDADVSPVVGENRTFEAILTTSDRYIVSAYSKVFYRKSFSEGAVDLSRFTGIVPLLLDHRNETRMVIGRVITASITHSEERSYLRGMLRIKNSTNPETEAILTEIMEDLNNGYIGGLSVGYTPLEYQLVDETGGEDTYEITKWQLAEVSMVAVPQDIRASIIKKQSMNIKKEKIMPPDVEPTQASPAPLQTGAATSGSPLVSPPPLPTNSEGLIVEGAPTPPTQPSPTITQPSPQASSLAPKPQARGADDLLIERGRCEAITQITAQAGMDPTKYIREGIAVETVKQLAMQKLASENVILPASKTSVTVGADGQDLLKEHFVEHLVDRGFGQPTKGGKRGNIFVEGMSIIEAARTFLGGSWRPLTNLFKETFGSGSLGNVLTDVMNKRLRDEIMGFLDPFAPLTRRIPLPSLKSAKINVLTADDFAQDVLEGQNIPMVDVQSLQDEIMPKGMGAAIGFTQEAFLRDDLSAIEAVRSSWGTGVVRRIIWEKVKLIVGSGTKAEGANLFSAAHGNVVSGQSGVTIANVKAARTLMALQTNLAGVPIAIYPRYIICSEDLRTDAAAFVRGRIVPTKLGDIKDSVSEGITGIISHPYIDSQLGSSDSKTDFYLAADQAQINVIQENTLAGFESPQMFSTFDDMSRTLVFGAMFYYGVGIANYRGLVRSYNS